MSYLRLKFNSRPLSLLFVWCLFLSMHSERAAAQSVSFSDVCASEDCGVEASADMATDGKEIDTYSSVENYFDEDVDSVAVAADLYDNTSGTLLQSGYDEEEDYAEVDLSTSINTPHEYELGTGISFCAEEDGNEGEGDCGYEAGPSFNLQIDADYPTVSSINPTSITVGTSGTITVNGQNFIDQFGDYPVPFINNSGVTLSLSSVSETQASVNYLVESNASTGDFGLNLKGLFGNGEPATLAVGDPTPVVTGISPSVWYAGNSYTVTITGTNFGTNPTSSISAAPGVTYSQTAGSDTSITASVTVAPNAPNTNPISVTVTSQGFGGGSGFFSGNGQSPTTSTTAQAVAGAPPAPVINLLNGTTASPFAGQLISLSVSPPSSAWTLASQTWIIGSTSDAVVNYIATSACGAPVPINSAPQAVCGTAIPAFSTTQTTLPSYYYIVPGATESVSVTATYSLAGGGTTASSPAASQTFTVGGPTGNLLSAWMAPNNQSLQIANANINGSSVPSLVLTGSSLNQNTPGSLGAVFSANSGDPPSSGAWVWVQLVNSDQEEIVEPAGSYDCPAQPVSGLDNGYPYSSGVSYVNDSPATQMNETGNAELQRSFKAKMYLMWDPRLSSSIPVPLQSVSWGFSGCGIDTLSTQSNGTTWTPAPGCPIAAPSAPQSSGYPHWTTTVTNEGQVTCGPHTY